MGFIPQGGAADSIIENLTANDALRMHKLCSLVQHAQVAFQ